MSEIEKADPGVRLCIVSAILLLLGGMSNWGHLSKRSDKTLHDCLLGDLLQSLGIIYSTGCRCTVTQSMVIRLLKG